MHDSPKQVLQLRSINKVSDPMARLPLEIVSMIFNECLPIIDDCLHDKPQISYGETLFRLSAVCKAWRQTLWTTPGFWKYMPLIIGTRNMADTPSIVQGWIERACKLPLSVTILVNYEDYPLSVSDEERFIKVANLINGSSSRLEKLVLKMPVSLLCQFSARAPDLKEICIYNSDDENLIRRDELEPYEPWIDQSYSLGLAKLEEMGQNSIPAMLSINRVLLKSIHASWDNLVEVDTKDIDIDDIFRILQQAPKLRELQLYESRVAPYILTEPVTPVAHTALVRLDIVALGADFLDVLFDNILQLPSLESLAIDVRWGLVNEECLARLMERSSCPLDELRITAPLANDAKVISMLKTMPHLTYLHLSPTRNSGRDFMAQNLFKYISEATQRRLLGISSRREHVPVVETFLPALKTFVYFPIGPEECKTIWDLIPDIFGSVQVEFPNKKSLNSHRVYYLPQVYSPKKPLPKFTTQTMASIRKLL